MYYGGINQAKELFDYNFVKETLEKINKKEKNKEEKEGEEEEKEGEEEEEKIKEEEKEEDKRRG